jgi:PAS domain S-box-containing protein
VFAKGCVADSPLTLRHKNGKLTDVLFNGSVYKDDQGNVLGVVIVARDVTAQKLLSKYSLSLIEASRDPLFTISPAGKITDTNQAAAKITDLSRNKLIGTDFYLYFTDHDKARKGYQEVFDKGFVADYPLTIMDGTLTDVLFNGSVYKDDRGNVLGAVVVARVITEQKRIEKELTEAKVFAELATLLAEEAKSKAESATKIAENAVKAKQQFLSNMSHEIRTPMNAIIGFTKVLLKTELSAKQKEYLTAIKMSGDALIVLINDILDLAKVDAEK